MCREMCALSWHCELTAMRCSSAHCGSSWPPSAVHFQKWLNSLKARSLQMKHRISCGAKYPSSTIIIEGMPRRVSGSLQGHHAFYFFLSDRRYRLRVNQTYILAYLSKIRRSSCSFILEPEWLFICPTQSDYQDVVNNNAFRNYVRKFRNSAINTYAHRTLSFLQLTFS